MSIGAGPPIAAQESTRLSLDAIRDLAGEVLRCNGVAAPTSDVLAERIMLAERDGPASHGLFMLPQYVSGLRRRSVDGMATPSVIRSAAAGILVDGCGGFAQAGIEMARPMMESTARSAGIALMSQRNAQHLGALRSDVEPFAEAGLIAIMFVAAARKRVVPAGHSRALLGTNPLAFAAPVAGRPPFVWDMATSASAITDVRMAAEAGTSIPPGIGVDSQGKETTDPREIINGGALLTFGGHKGTAISMMIEIVAAGLTGGLFAGDDRAVDKPGGASAHGGQCLIVIDPGSATGTDVAQRLAEWFASFGHADGGRFPGDGRLVRRAATLRDGVEVRRSLLERLQALR